MLFEIETNSINIWFKTQLELTLEIFLSTFAPRFGTIKCETKITRS